MNGTVVCRDSVLLESTDLHSVVASVKGGYDMRLFITSEGSAG